jgi:hypothetical protein
MSRKKDIQTILALDPPPNGDREMARSQLERLSSFELRRVSSKLHRDQPPSGGAAVTAVAQSRSEFFGRIRMFLNGSTAPSLRVQFQ